MINILLELTTKNLPIIKLIFLIKEILNIILIIVPVILILIGSIDIIKVLINPNTQKEVLSKSVKRIMYGVIIFFVPIIVNYIVSLVSNNNQFDILNNNINKTTINNLQKLKNTEIAAQKKAHDEKIKKLKEEELAQKERSKSEQAQNNTSNSQSSSNSSTREKLVKFALKYVGKPYVWGGNNLNTGVDCSGFTQQVYKHFGISIPRTTSTQINIGKKVDINNLKKGDLIFYNARSNHHVAIYIGNGQIVHAKGRKWGIVVDNVSYSSPLKGVSIIND